jgi:type II secretory pathway pseudopilin PulG
VVALILVGTMALALVVTWMGDFEEAMMRECASGE